jgi:hypothetical protein
LDESNKVDKKKKDKIMANILKKKNKEEITTFLGSKFFKCNNNEMTHNLMQSYIKLSSDNKKVKDDIKKKILAIHDDLENKQKIKNQFISLINGLLKKRYTTKFIANIKKGKLDPSNVVSHIKQTDAYEKIIENVNPELNDEKALLKSDIFDKFDIEAEKYIIDVLSTAERKSELVRKLAKKGLTLRDDSKLCKYYIEGGMDRVTVCCQNQNITSLDDIVDIMDEMDFYYAKTNYDLVYDKIMRQYIYNQDSDGNYSDSDDEQFYAGQPDPSVVSLRAKTDVLKKFDIKKCTYVPKNVLKLYNSIHEK